MPSIEVYSDGSATTNDKPGGYGWVMCVDGQKHSEGSGHMLNASNNDAELEAAIQGLKAAQSFLTLKALSDLSGTITPADRMINVISEVTLVSDSQLILGWATGKYAFRQEDKRHKFQELQLLVNLLSVKTRWVEGHSGDEHNERCDKLANEARLGIQSKSDKAEAILEGKTLIGRKKTGVVGIWYKNVLKIVSLEDNIVETYDREIHGPRGSVLEIREDKLR